VVKFDERRKFGIEIEFLFSGTREAAAEVVNDALLAEGLVGCVAEPYGHDGDRRTNGITSRRHWKVVPDGSISRGWELVSPPMSGFDGKRQLEIVTQALRDAGASVGSSTGLHVHHDARRLTSKQIGNAVALYTLHQREIDMLVSPSRRNLRWCAPNDYRRLADVVENGGFIQPTEMFVLAIAPNAGFRYRAVNVRAWIDHGTVEFRQHQGSLNARKIWDWVVFTQLFVTTAANRKSARDLPPIRKFNPENPMRGLRSHLSMTRETDRDETTESAFHAMERRYAASQRPTRPRPSQSRRAVFERERDRARLQEANETRETERIRQLTSNEPRAMTAADAETERIRQQEARRTWTA
jgi:hypothetical protein